MDPVCTVDGQIHWTLVNPNSKNFTVDYYTVDGGPHQPGMNVPPGKHNLTTTTGGTHTVTVYFGESQNVSLTSTIDVCPLPVPETGSNLLIPVTGADFTGSFSNLLFFGSLSFAGLGLLLTAIRKLFTLQDLSK